MEDLRTIIPRQQVRRVKKLLRRLNSAEHSTEKLSSTTDAVFNLVVGDWKMQKRPHCADYRVKRAKGREL